MNPNRTERILTPEERAKYNLPSFAEGINRQNRSGRGKNIGLCAFGIAAGVVGAAGVSAYAIPTPPKEPEYINPGVLGTRPEDPITAPAENDVTNEEGQQSVVVEEPTLDTVKFASSPDDSMPFGQAFALARAEVGPNGVFEWRGTYYGTFYSEEWRDLPASYREQFSNHDWSELQLSEPTHPNDHVAGITEVTIIVHDGGRVEIVLTNASTGEPIHYFPDGEVVPVFDDHGQVIAMVNKSALQEAERTGGVLAILPSGDPVIVDDPANISSLFEENASALAEDHGFDPLEEVSDVEVVEGSDDDIFAMVEDDSDPAGGAFSMIDENPVVLDINEDVHIAEVVDGNYEFIPDAETIDDFDPTFDGDSENDLALSDDDINFEDHGMVDDSHDEMMDDEMFLS